MTMSILGYASPSEGRPTWPPTTLHGEIPAPNDVVIEILYCGICHSDLHQARDDWNNTFILVVPGHER